MLITCLWPKEEKKKFLHSFRQNTLLSMQIDIPNQPLHKAVTSVFLSYAEHTEQPDTQHKSWTTAHISFPASLLLI